MPHPSHTLRCSSFGSCDSIRASIGSLGRLSVLAAPAGMDGPVVSRRFLATVELAIWETLGHTAAVRRPPIGSLIGWHLRTPFRHGPPHLWRARAIAATRPWRRQRRSRARHAVVHAPCTRPPYTSSAHVARLLDIGPVGRPHGSGGRDHWGSTPPVVALRAFATEDLLRAVMTGTFAPRVAAQWPKVH